LDPPKASLKFYLKEWVPWRPSSSPFPQTFFLSFWTFPGSPGASTFPLLVRSHLNDCLVVSVIPPSYPTPFLGRRVEPVWLHSDTFGRMAYAGARPGNAFFNICGWCFPFPFLPCRFLHKGPVDHQDGSYWDCIYGRRAEWGGRATGGWSAAWVGSWSF